MDLFKKKPRARRGRTIERIEAEREGSPEPPREAETLLEEEEPELDEANDELEGFEHVSEATGFYTNGKRGAKFPKDIQVELWDCKGDIYKTAECHIDRVGELFEAFVAEGYYKDAVKANPPIGSWALYIDHFTFVDTETHAEIRFDCVPGDGLSKYGTTSDFTDGVKVHCELLDHPKAGPRSWMFQLTPYAPIIPDVCEVQVFAKQKKVHILLAKAERALWPNAGQLYAPVTKDNYRQIQNTPQIQQ